jgi:hypothetical protein
MYLFDVCRSAFHVERFTKEYVYIVDDFNPRFPTVTVTNDADAVVSRLFSFGLLSCSQRVFYKDSCGCMDELLHVDGRFKGFAPGCGEFKLEVSNERF